MCVLKGLRDSRPCRREGEWRENHRRTRSVSPHWSLIVILWKIINISSRDWARAKGRRKRRMCKTHTQLTWRRHRNMNTSPIQANQRLTSKTSVLSSINHYLANYEFKCKVIIIMMDIYGFLEKFSVRGFADQRADHLLGTSALHLGFNYGQNERCVCEWLLGRVWVLLSGSKHLPSVLETIQITRNRRQTSAMDRKKNKQQRTETSLMTFLWTVSKASVCGVWGVQRGACWCDRDVHSVTHSEMRCWPLELGDIVVEALKSLIFMSLLMKFWGTIFLNNHFRQDSKCLNVKYREIVKTLIFCHPYVLAYKLLRKSLGTVSFFFFFFF